MNRLHPDQSASAELNIKSETIHGQAEQTSLNSSPLATYIYAQLGFIAKLLFKEILIRAFDWHRC
jgi:hypothetical protein